MANPRGQGNDTSNLGGTGAPAGPDETASGGFTAGPTQQYNMFASAPSLAAAPAMSGTGASAPRSIGGNVANPSGGTAAQTWGTPDVNPTLAGVTPTTNTSGAGSQNPRGVGGNSPNPSGGTVSQTWGNDQTNPLLTGQRNLSQPASETLSGAQTGAPFSGSPFVSSVSTTGNPLGNQAANNKAFVTTDAANSIAKYLGGKVSQMDMQGGLGFTQPGYYIQMPDGSTVDPAQFAQAYQLWGDSPAFKAYTQGILAGGGQTGPGPQQRNPVTGAMEPANTGIMENASPGSAWIPGLQVGRANGTVSTVPQNPYSTPAQYQTGGGYGSTLGNFGGLDVQSLLQILGGLNPTLQAYGGLGAGAGNPTSINQSGQIGQLLSMILGGGVGGDLYSRQRLYPQFQ